MERRYLKTNKQTKKNLEEAEQSKEKMKTKILPKEQIDNSSNKENRQWKHNGGINISRMIKKDTPMKQEQDAMNK